MKLSLLTTLALLATSLSATAINNNPAGDLISRASANDAFCSTVKCTTDTPCKTAKCGKCDAKKGRCKGDGVPKGTCHKRICNFPDECAGSDGCRTCGEDGYCV